MEDTPMSLMLNPVEQAIVESCSTWKLREELVAHLSPLADAETIERALGFLRQRRLIEPLAVSSRAYGATTYHATDLGRRMLRIHHRRLTQVHANFRGPHLV
jgi:hypothetical protein